MIFFIVKVISVHVKNVNNTRRPKEENLCTPTTQRVPIPYLVFIFLAFLFFLAIESNLLYTPR